MCADAMARVQLQYQCTQHEGYTHTTAEREGRRKAHAQAQTAVVRPEAAVTETVALEEQKKQQQKQQQHGQHTQKQKGKKKKKQKQQHTKKKQKKQDQKKKKKQKEAVPMLEEAYCAALPLRTPGRRTPRRASAH
jgi:outer membrane biosynthesis protein TonB